MDSRLARSIPAAINSMHPDPAPPCSSPTARMPAATAADTELRLPEIASRAVAHDGAPDPWSATLDSIASSSARSASDGSRDRCSRKMVSVNVCSVMSDVTSCPRNADRAVTGLDNGGTPGFHIAPKAL